MKADPEASLEWLGLRKLGPKTAELFLVNSYTVIPDHWDPRD